MQPNLFSRLCWDPSPNKLQQAWSWQGAEPAPQPRVLHSAGSQDRCAGSRGRVPASLTATLHPGFPPARTAQCHATAWGSCWQLGVHATAWEVPLLIPKSKSLLMQHHPGSPLTQPAHQGIPSGAGGAAAEQALDGFGISACEGTHFYSHRDPGWGQDHPWVPQALARGESQDALDFWCLAGRSREPQSFQRNPIFTIACPAVELLLLTPASPTGQAHSATLSPCRLSLALISL